MGISFIPSFIPVDLSLFRDSYHGTFISEYIDNTIFWTVAYDKNLLFYDNFGMFYSNSFEDEYDPSRRNLFIEVSKDELPKSDTIYSYDTGEISKIGNNNITVGVYKAPYYNGEDQPSGYAEHYIAEFIVEGIGYRIISENLTQEEFIKVLLSLPAFQ